MNGISINVSKYQSMSVTYKKSSIDYTQGKESSKDITEIKYSRSQKDELTISMLQEESDKAYGNLRRIVEDLLKRQGIQLGKLGKGHGKNKADKPNSDEEKMVKIDEKTQKEAQYMIGPNGPFNAENTSDRIVKFAKAISHGDKSKLEELKESIKAGFEAVKEIFGELPELSQKTYDLVMEKLDAWENSEDDQDDKVVEVA